MQKGDTNDSDIKHIFSFSEGKLQKSPDIRIVHSSFCHCGPSKVLRIMRYTMHNGQDKFKYLHIVWDTEPLSTFKSSWFLDSKI